MPKGQSIFRQKRKTFCPQPYSVEQITMLKADEGSQKPIKAPFSFLSLYSTPSSISLAFLQQGGPREPQNMRVLFLFAVFFCLVPTNSGNCLLGGPGEGSAGQPFMCGSIWSMGRAPRGVSGCRGATRGSDPSHHGLLCEEVILR